LGSGPEVSFPHDRAASGRLGSGMTDSADSSQLLPEDLIEQAIGILMNHLDVDATLALDVLERMSVNTRTQLCVVAEQIINHSTVGRLWTQGLEGQITAVPPS